MREADTFMHLLVRGGIQKAIGEILTIRYEDHACFTLYANGEEVVVARFWCRELMGCHGISVFYGLHINKDYRRRGLGALIQRLYLEACRQSGFGLCLCTSREDNDIQNKILTRLEWQKLKTFKNPQTGNWVGLWMRQL